MSYFDGEQDVDEDPVCEAAAAQLDGIIESVGHHTVSGSYEKIQAVRGLNLIVAMDDRPSPDALERYVIERAAEIKPAFLRALRGKNARQLREYYEKRLDGRDLLDYNRRPIL